jgi:hypothetical protein
LLYTQQPIKKDFAAYGIINTKYVRQEQLIPILCRLEEALQLLIGSDRHYTRCITSSG